MLKVLYYKLDNYIKYDGLNSFLSNLIYITDLYSLNLNSIWNLLDNTVNEDVVKLPYEKLNNISNLSKLNLESNNYI